MWPGRHTKSDETPRHRHIQNGRGMRWKNMIRWGKYGWAALQTYTEIYKEKERKAGCDSLTDATKTKTNNNRHTKAVEKEERWERRERIEWEKKMRKPICLQSPPIHNDNNGKTTGEMHGTGKLLYGNGDFYEGGFTDNRRQGRGQFRETDGSVYTG